MYQRIQFDPLTNTRVCQIHLRWGQDLCDLEIPTGLDNSGIVPRQIVKFVVQRKHVTTVVIESILNCPLGPVIRCHHS